MKYTDFLRLNPKHWLGLDGLDLHNKEIWDQLFAAFTYKVKQLLDQDSPGSQEMYAKELIELLSEVEKQHPSHATFDILMDYKDTLVKLCQRENSEYYCGRAMLALGRPGIARAVDVVMRGESFPNVIGNFGGWDLQWAVYTELLQTNEDRSVYTLGKWGQLLKRFVTEGDTPVEK